MSEVTRIEEAYRLPRWARRAAESRIAAVAAAEVKLSDARDDVADLLHHIRAICGDRDARAWCFAIGIDRATLRRFWNKSSARKRERAA